MMPKEGTRYALVAMGASNGTDDGTSASSAGNVCIDTFRSDNLNHLWEIVDVS